MAKDKRSEFSSAPIVDGGMKPGPITRLVIFTLVLVAGAFAFGLFKDRLGNPFLLGELLTEAAARGVEPSAAAAAEVGSMVPRGVANAVLLRVARLAPEAGMLARALSALGDGAQVGDQRRDVGNADALFLEDL